MNLAAHLPSTTHSSVAVLALALVLLAAAFEFGVQAFSNDTRSVQVKHVEKSWGKPSTSVDGAQVNPQLAGMTCDVYNSRQTVVCHP